MKRMNRVPAKAGGSFSVEPNIDPELANTIKNLSRTDRLKLMNKLEGWAKELRVILGVKDRAKVLHSVVLIQPISAMTDLN